MVCTIYERRLLKIIPIKRRPKRPLYTRRANRQSITKFSPPLAQSFFYRRPPGSIPPSMHPDEQQTLLLLDYD